MNSIRTGCWPHATKAQPVAVQGLEAATTQRAASDDAASNQPLADGVPKKLVDDADMLTAFTRWGASNTN
jgi:hypothetical protein